MDLSGRKWHRFEDLGPFFSLLPLRSTKIVVLLGEIPSFATFFFFCCTHGSSPGQGLNLRHSHSGDNATPLTRCVTGEFHRHSVFIGCLALLGVSGESERFLVLILVHEIQLIEAQTLHWAEASDAVSFFLNLLM